MNKLQLRAALWLAGGQCGTCILAVWDRRRVKGCAVGESDGPLGPIVGAMLFQQAQRKDSLPCVARVHVGVGPDAYLAQDLPERATLQAILQDKKQ